jgi:hypothetical protein
MSHHSDRQLFLNTGIASVSKGNDTRPVQFAGTEFPPRRVYAARQHEPRCVCSALPIAAVTCVSWCGWSSCYNASEDRAEMSQPRNLRGTFDRPPAWHVLVVVLAILALTVSLATRTFRLTIPHAVTVYDGSAQATRQHMDRDAASWIPPVPVLTTLQAPVFYPNVAPAGPPLPKLLFEEGLYNRPPPSV